MPAWFCKIDGKVYGPYTGDHLRQMAREERLLPRDSLREGQDGDWFPAAEMENLFPEAPDAAEEEPPSRRKVSGKPSNYYRVFFRNLTEGGQWRVFLGITIGVGLVLALIFSVIHFLAWGFLRHPGAIAAGFVTNAFFALILPAFYLFLDGLLFGIPCVLLRVRFDSKRHGVLDLLALCYLLALAPKLAVLIAEVINPLIGVFLTLLYPLLHAGVLVYFMIAWWDFPAPRAWILAGIRFAYQTLFLAGYIAVWLLL